MRDLQTFASIVRAARPVPPEVRRDREDGLSSDLAWLAAGAPVALVLMWFIIAAQR